MISIIECFIICNYFRKSNKFLITISPEIYRYPQISSFLTEKKCYKNHFATMRKYRIALNVNVQKSVVKDAFPRHFSRIRAPGVSRHANPRCVHQFAAHEYWFIPALVGREFTGSMACLPYSKANRNFDINQTGALKDVDVRGGGGEGRGR